MRRSGYNAEPRVEPVIPLASSQIKKPGVYRCVGCSSKCWWTELVDGKCITCRNSKVKEKR